MGIELSQKSSNMKIFASVLALATTVTANNDTIQLSAAEAYENHQQWELEHKAKMAAHEAAMAEMRENLVKDAEELALSLEQLNQARIQKLIEEEQQRVEAYEKAKELNDTLHAEFMDWQTLQDALRANGSDYLSAAEQQALLDQMEAENAAKEAEKETQTEFDENAS